MAGSPRDIALAVRIRPDGAPPGAADGQEGEAVRPGRSELEVEEAFDELGMELIDEDAGEEEDEMQGLGERCTFPCLIKSRRGIVTITHRSIWTS